MTWVRWCYGLRNVHPTAYISRGGYIDIHRDTIIGAYAFIGCDCVIMQKTKIGRYSMLAPRASIVGADHRIDLPNLPMVFAGRGEIRETVIEDDVWIGHAAIIMNGIRIGRGSIIGANAVVTRDVPPREIWVGIPAKKLRDRFASKEESQAHEHLLEGPTIPPNFCD